MNKADKDSSVDIKSIRVQMDLTQENLARELGVSLSTVSRWETGRSRPSQLAMHRLLELVNGKNN